MPVATPGRDRVEAARVERVAAQDAPGGHGHALEHAVCLDGLEGILTAGGVETAARDWLESRQVAAVEPDRR